MNREGLIIIANQAAGKIFDKPDFKPIQNQIFTRREFIDLCRESILEAMLTTQTANCENPLTKILMM